MKVFAVLTAWALWVLPLLSLAEGVRYRGIFVQDDFWKGLPIRYALRRLPSGTKSLTLKVLPWGEGASERIFIDHSKAPANSKETTANRWLDAGAGRESEDAAEAPREV